MKAFPTRLRARTRPPRQGGYGLVEIIIVSAIGAVMFAALVKGLSDTSKSARKISSSIDIASIKSRLTESISCRETFKGKGSPPTPCAAGTYIDLKSENGAILIPKDGGRIGDWTVGAQCTASGLDIRAAKLAAGAPSGPVDFTAAYVAAHFVRDEMGGENRDAGGRPLRYDWEHPKARLFTAGLNSLCADWFAAPPTPNAADCGDGKYMIGVNFMMRTPNCESIPVCTGANALTFDGRVFRCSDDINRRVAVLDGKLRALTRAVKARPRIREVSGNNESQCGDEGRMSCPSGHVAIGWSAWVTSSNIRNCKLRCLDLGL